MVSAADEGVMGSDCRLSDHRERPVTLARARVQSADCNQRESAAHAEPDVMTNLPADSTDPAAFNAACFCIGVDLDALRGWLQDDLGWRGLNGRVVDTHPHLFSAAPVFVSREQVDEMCRIVAAIEAVTANPEYRARALRNAPSAAEYQPTVQGILQGYDFHLTTAGPKLIEVNTNAGGALLNIELIRAAHACCDEVARLVSGPNDADLEQRVLQMFLDEWQHARGEMPLRRIAIVDEDPAGQYLYPEFLLFQRLFESHGIDTVITDPAHLTFRDGNVHDPAGPIDLIYNRLTDFYFESARNSVLREAYLAGAVITPHPREHALYANKRNLALLSDPAQLAAWDVDPEIVSTLQRGVPATEVVRADAAERLWRERGRLFFKPVSGFAGRGSYRGSKLTRRTFEQILQGSYVAQALVAPGLRLHAPDAAQPLKFDVRLYAHRGDVLMIAARLYQGQTTNFRTEGGGFAPVFYPPEHCAPLC
jgi:glutathione synthase/RimK-type ligase-like ATP-grasp enzyme